MVDGRKEGRHLDVAILCRNCLREIEACLGVYGDWMHRDNRTERCDLPDDPGRTATPETANDITARESTRTGAYRTRLR